DLGRMNPCVEKVLELVAIPLTHPEVYLHISVQPPRSVLLHGPSACGKTLLANAIGGNRVYRSFRFRPRRSCRIVSGESDMKLHETFEEAKRVALRLLFVDEIDTISLKRETTQSKTECRIVAQLLTWMDGKLPLKVVIQVPNTMCVYYLRGTSRL
ncbi:P-loop containing nucleoside triphosphate hydrolase protein, partial [Lactarius pseudohatsudake]